jgi:peptidoglycan hydrolase CwlO-like protein
MFVYQGKLNWYHYAKDETFVIILPSGPVRVGDSVYLFSQWTEDAQGRKKQNWFSTITVDTVTQTDSSDVTFVLKGSWYNFTVTTKGGYKDLSLVMRNPSGGVSSPMSLQRIWESKQELTGTTRVWTGKFKWMNFADNEPAIFIVPDGFGEGKPILSTWQWTKASNGKTKDPSFRDAVQKNVTGLGTDTVKFSYHSYYDINCIWDANKDQLDVHVAEGRHTEDVGDMIRSAIIERQQHTHDPNPVEPAPEKGQCELRKPQPQASLPRIMDPMPFPKGLLETLAHTASFVDQAGYLAKYALDQFSTLDAAYHVEIEKVKAKDAEITNLKKTVEDLTSDRSAAKAKVEELQKQLEQANKDAQALRDEIAKLNKYISEDTVKDEKARKILEETQKKLEALMEEKSNLRKELDTANSTIKELNSRVADYQQQIIQRDTEISRLKAQIHAQMELNKTLTAKNSDLNAKVDELKTGQVSLEDELNRANARIQALLQKNKEARKEITDAEDERDKARAEVTAANRQRAEAVEELEDIKQKLYEQKIVLK